MLLDAQFEQIALFRAAEAQDEADRSFGSVRVKGIFAPPIPEIYEVMAIIAIIVCPHIPELVKEYADALLHPFWLCASP
jgi:hypothetical protein